MGSFVRGLAGRKQNHLKILGYTPATCYLLGLGLPISTYTSPFFPLPPPPPLLPFIPFPSVSGVWLRPGCRCKVACRVPSNMGIWDITQLSHQMSIVVVVTKIFIHVKVLF